MEFKLKAQTHIRMEESVQVVPHQGGRDDHQQECKESITMLESASDCRILLGNIF